MKGLLQTPGVQIVGPALPGFETILTDDALAFVAQLERRFRDRRAAILAARVERQASFDAGERPDFLEATDHIRTSEWSVAPAPADLVDRRVEITGPVDRKMIINGLNSGACVFMADFEDASAPTFANMVEGQINLRDAVAGTIEFTNARGKKYQLNENPAVLMVRPRGWHLDERHVLVDGQPVSASIFDFALFLFHNAEALIARGSGPYFYLPKLEGHQEARLWNEIFVIAQEALGIEIGTIKATVLIETITAAFEMEEILFELRSHSVGLNCGRWDYIFSVIKKFRNDPGFVMPDRSVVTMKSHFLEAYSLLLIQTCHRRGAHAMGGMAAQIPIKHDRKKNGQAVLKVIEDKEREALNGHDGTWVAHPGLIPLARSIFDDHLLGPNQLDVSLSTLTITAEDLLKTPSPDGGITENGLRTNLRVGVQYLAAWLCGSGCVPLNSLMEDAATAEISRAQVWQWVRHDNGVLDDGRNIDLPMVETVLAEETERIKSAMSPEEFADGRVADAAALFARLIADDNFADFLTLPAYEIL